MKQGERVRVQPVGESGKDVTVVGQVMYWSASHVAIGVPDMNARSERFFYRAVEEDDDRAIDGPSWVRTSPPPRMTSATFTISKEGTP